VLPVTLITSRISNRTRNLSAEEKTSGNTLCDLSCWGWLRRRRSQDRATARLSFELDSRRRCRRRTQALENLTLVKAKASSLRITDLLYGITDGVGHRGNSPKVRELVGHHEQWRGGCPGRSRSPPLGMWRLNPAARAALDHAAAAAEECDQLAAAFSPSAARLSNRKSSKFAYAVLRLGPELLWHATWVCT
jgi:hypothetical protein